MATLKLKLKNGECSATVDGSMLDIIEGLATLLITSPDMLMLFKASVEVAELQNQELNQEK